MSKKAKRQSPKRSHVAQTVRLVLAMSPAERRAQRQQWHDEALRKRLIAQGIIRTPA